MRMLTLWTAAGITATLVLTASVISASAQIQTRGAAGLHAQMAKRHAARAAGRLSRLGSLLSAGYGPPLRALPLLVRSLLLTPRSIPL
jgi:hypothetical protein